MNMTTTAADLSQRPPEPSQTWNSSSPPLSETGEENENLGPVAVPPLRSTSAPRLEEGTTRPGIRNNLVPPRPLLPPPPRLRTCSASALPPPQPDAAASAKVHTLFGLSRTVLGPCWGEFFCTHHRLGGRLYVTSRAVLFYSTWLGFERRLCLDLRQVRRSELYRQTSLRIWMRDGETHIFKALEQREQVCHMLQTLQAMMEETLRSQGRPPIKKPEEVQAQQQVPPPPTPLHDSEQGPALPNRPNPHALMEELEPDEDERTLMDQCERQQTVDRLASPRSTKAFDPDDTAPLPSLPPLSGPLESNRRRSVSDSILRSGPIMSASLPQPSSSTSLMSTTGLHRVYSQLSTRSSALQDDHDVGIMTRTTPAGAVVEMEDFPDLALSEHGLVSAPSKPLQMEDSVESSLAVEEGEGDLVRLEHWQSAKTKLKDYSDVGIENLTLDCSLEQFITWFLADGAPYSLDRYQQDHVNDRNVQVTPWRSHQNHELHDHYLTDVKTGEPSGWERLLTFTHPIKNSLGVGPSAAQTRRRQRWRRFGAWGLILENRTTVEDVPGADAFFVRDYWVVEVQEEEQDELNESMSEEQGLSLDRYPALKGPGGGSGTTNRRPKGPFLRLCTRFTIQFTKTSLFRSFIERSIRKESQDWWSGWKQMARQALHHEFEQVVSAQRRVSEASSPPTSTDYVNLHSCATEVLNKDGGNMKKAIADGVGENTHLPGLATVSDGVLRREVATEDAVLLLRQIKRLLVLIAFMLVLMWITMMVLLLRGAPLATVSSNVPHLDRGMLLDVTGGVDVDNMGESRIDRGVCRTEY